MTNKVNQPLYFSWRGLFTANSLKFACHNFSFVRDMHAAKQRNNPNEVSSLAIIEECLDRIYLSRRTNLINKARKFKEKQARKAHQQQERPAYTRMRGETDSAMDDTDSDTQIMEELALKFKAPPPTVAAAQNDKKPDAIAALAKTYEDQDATSLEVFREFCDEVNCIVDDYPARIPDDEFRGEYCDALMHKYLSLKLDKMMATRTVAKVRKHVAGIIEQFAASEDVAELLSMIQSALDDCNKAPAAKKENLPHVASATSASNSSAVATASKSTVKESTQTKNNTEKSIANTNSALPAIEAKKSAATAPSKAAVKPSPEPVNTAPINNVDNPVAGVEKQKLEKQRIKAQYEQLMSLKKKTENHPDDNTINEYTSLHADIQSVIDSIQQRPAAQAESKPAKKTPK